MADLDSLARALKSEADRRTYERWRFYTPAPKHREFFDAGAKYMERALMAGNGCGKTESAAYEVSRHLTGEYPPDWKGYRFDRPIKAWAAGASGVEVRDTAQTKLCGQPGVADSFGSGMVPRDRLLPDPAKSRGVADSYDSIQVRHVSGGISRLVFKTYQQRREDWQGPDLDLYWNDEEAPEQLHTEGIARLRGKGLALSTFTPLLGITDMVSRFTERTSPTRYLVQMSLMDCPWYTDDQRQKLVENFPPHERQARIYGYPMLGEGKVFSTPAEDLEWPHYELGKVPLAWAKLWGVDFGIDHPFAAVLLGWDRDEDAVYVLRSIRMRDSIPLQHADAMRRVASNVPVAWPHDGHVRDKGSGEELASIYRKHGLQMLRDHSTHITGGYATEPGILALEERMRAGRFKVDAGCRDWFEEYGSYHRKNGLIVKERDDLMSATRIAHMMLRQAKPVALGFSRTPFNARRPREAPPLDPWTGKPIY